MINKANETGTMIFVLHFPSLPSLNYRECFVSCGFFVHCYQTSLLTTLLPDNKNCVRILKGSYIVMKCSDNKVYETI